MDVSESTKKVLVINICIYYNTQHTIYNNKLLKL